MGAARAVTLLVGALASQPALAVADDAEDLNAGDPSVSAGSPALEARTFWISLAYDR